MIGHLNYLIRQAEAKKDGLETQKAEFKAELLICQELKPLLGNIYDKVSNGISALENTKTELNNGINIDGVGQGEQRKTRMH